MLEARGGHMYRKGGGTRPISGATIFCVYGCKCYKDSHGFGGPAGSTPEGECPNAPVLVHDKLQLMLNDPDSHL